MVSPVKQFIIENKKKLMIDEKLESMFRKAGYAGVVISKMPLGHQVVIQAEKPGIIIGRKGYSIRDLALLLKQEYQLEDPQIDVKGVEVPELNARIMAGRLRSYLEHGARQKRVAFAILDSILKAGAMGAEVSLRGKFTTDRSRFIKLRKGQIHQSGEQANLVDKAVTNVLLKPGIIGIKVKISLPTMHIPQVVFKQVDQSVLSSLKKQVESEKPQGSLEAQISGETAESATEEVAQEPLPPQDKGALSNE
ncbi:MAG: 30S ribosomal protein S3 [Thermoprotei archaeon]